MIKINDNHKELMIKTGKSLFGRKYKQKIHKL